MGVVPRNYLTDFLTPVLSRIGMKKEVRLGGALRGLGKHPGKGGGIINSCLINLIQRLSGRTLNTAD